jgi:hypothetical protein
MAKKRRAGKIYTVECQDWTFERDPPGKFIRTQINRGTRCKITPPTNKKKKPIYVPQIIMYER